jgi:transcription regulator MmyB-like protein
MRSWWAEYTIRDFRPATIAVDHPGIGVIELEIFQLRPVEHPDMVLVLQVPAGRDARQRVSSLLGDS